MVRLIPFFVLSEHCIQDGQQFAHTGNQRYFFRFSCCNQPGIKRFNNWIVAGCHECGHVQRSSHTRPTTKDGSSASHRARVPVYWGNAHESANFSSRETPQLGFYAGIPENSVTKTKSSRICMTLNKLRVL